MHVFSFLCVIFPRRPGLLHTGSFLSKSDRRLSPKLIVPWLIYSLLHFSQQSQFIIIELENVSVSYYEKFKFDDNWLMLENYAFSRVELVVPKFALWTEVAHWNPSKWTCFDFSEQRFIEITDGLSIDALRFTDESENDSFRSWCIWNTETSPTKSRHWTSARWHVTSVWKAHMTLKSVTYLETVLIAGMTVIFCGLYFRITADIQSLIWGLRTVTRWI